MNFPLKRDSYAVNLLLIRGLFLCVLAGKDAP